jgi:hypothetical protein
MKKLQSVVGYNMPINNSGAAIMLQKVQMAATLSQSNFTMGYHNYNFTAS